VAKEDLFPLLGIGEDLEDDEEENETYIVTEEVNFAEIADDLATEVFADEDLQILVVGKEGVFSLDKLQAATIAIALQYFAYVTQLVDVGH